ncbi:MAG: NAD(P)H-hydrate dehydratase [Pyrinomonadaceae bacterium]|nr:NAD(P)H-hydrate dehydratase [Pyrinomonadaceae bacterium]
MQKVLTAKEMREVDRLTTEKYGIPSIILMENAAHAASGIITGKFHGSVNGKSVLILCGKGNNGGDGAALARVLWQAGAIVSLYLFAKLEETKGDAHTNFQTVASLSKTGEILFEDDVPIDDRFGNAEFDVSKFDLIVDAVFGTGLTGSLDSIYSDFCGLHSLRKDNDGPIFVSLDIPSGLNSNRPKPTGINFQSDLTVTFTAAKPANVLPPASNYNGELYIANIGSPKELVDNSHSKTFLAESQDAQSWLQSTQFSSDSYKSKRGNALLVVGSKKYTGAAVLAGNGAIQSGVGLVTVITPESASSAVAERVLPEVMVNASLETENGSIDVRAFGLINKLGEKADVIAIGSGLGSEEESTRNLVSKVVENRQTPVIIDADGLNSLSPVDLKGSEDHPLILTPHVGEFLKLIGIEDKEAIANRVLAVRDFAEKHSVILVLKGARTLIAGPDGKVVINPTGNSGLGKAGNGDNLTGIITGFVAQAVQMNVGVFETVVAAVYIAGLAGDIAEKKFGKRTMLASDVRDCLVKAFAEVEKTDE